MQALWLKVGSSRFLFGQAGSDRPRIRKEPVLSMKNRLLLTTILTMCVFFISLGMRNAALGKDPRPKPRPRAVIEHVLKASDELCSGECSSIQDAEAAPQRTVVPLPSRTRAPFDHQRTACSRYANALPVPRAPPVPPCLVS